ncbi:MAG: chorismate mutase [Syntrophobacteraceae bacterium]
MEKEISKIREEIDRIDSELLGLLNRRMELAAGVGRIKASKGIPLFHPEREEIIFNRLSTMNSGPLEEESLRSIYREILAASRLLQAGRFDMAARGHYSPHRAGRGICGCLVNCSPEEFSDYINHPELDMVEWRIDEFCKSYSEERMVEFFTLLSASPRHGILVTNRPMREMGSYGGTEDERLELISRAVTAGAEWVDLEHDVAGDNIASFRNQGAKVLVSYHSPSETPSRASLRARLEAMCKTGGDAIKIATFARSEEDTLRVLELIPLARREFQTDLIAFCMGPAGRWSRPACLVFGSPWTYAFIPGQPPAAPGQLSTMEIRTVLDILEGV